jgi:hypothetical protein
MMNVMKTAEEIGRALDEVLAAHYYSKESTLRWALGQFEESLAPGEKDLFRRLVLDRLRNEPSVMNAVLVSCCPSPESAPVLAAVLSDQPTTSVLTRVMINALEGSRDETAYRAVERFIDSEQESDALAALLTMDFARAAPRFRVALKQELLEAACLHMLSRRRAAVGLEQLIADLAEHVVGDSAYARKRVAAVLDCRDGNFNPFSKKEREAIKRGLGCP